MDNLSNCPECSRLESEIRYQAQRDYRVKMALWAEYEKHRRECHHVLHVAVPADTRAKTRA